MVRRRTPNDLYISVVVIGEIRQGIERLRQRDKHRAGELEHWLDALQRVYADRIVPITAEIADRWGRLSAGSALPAWMA